MLECPLYNPINDELQSPLENIVPGDPQIFFQSNHHVNISLYLSEGTALRHLKKLAGLNPS
jgi:hypothetical protein